MSSDKNLKDLNYQSLKGKLMACLQEYSSLSSFVDNELLKLPYEKYEEYSDESNIIKENLFSIKKLFDTKEHVLTPNEEKILANYGIINSSYANLYRMLQSSDFTPIKVELSNEVVEVSPNTYTSILTRLENQDDRRKVFEALFGYYE